MKLLKYKLFFIIIMFNNNIYALNLNLWTYLKKYQLGIDYSVNSSNLSLTYKSTWYIDPLKTTCIWTNATSYEIAGYSTCTKNLGAGNSSGWGIYLQQPFNRQGLFYFDADLGIGLRSFESKLENETDYLLPLNKVHAYLYGIVFKGYIKIGFTPKAYFPDIFVSGGKQIQIVTGRTTINDNKTEWAAMINRLEDSFIVDTEIVIIRFNKTGEFSVYYTLEDTGNVYAGSFNTANEKETGYKKKIYDISAGFSQRGFGVKLLLPSK